jgi:hypothetical protein
MDWQRTNDSTVARWADRPTPASPTYSTDGVSLEDICELANELEKDIWICTPHLADDDYVRQQASLIRAKLDPKRVCYIERSNETWNYIFDQAQHNLKQAQADAAAGYDYGSTDLNVMRFRRHARRTVEDSILTGVGDPRFRIVLASHVGYGVGDQPKTQLEFIAWKFGPPAKYIYGIAGAPYLSLGKNAAGVYWGDTDGLTTEFILSTLSMRAVTAAAGEGTVVYHNIARQYGVKSLGYELGVDVRVSSKSSAAKLAAMRDPRMAAIVYDYLMNWRRAGGDQFTYFAHAAEDGPKTFWGSKRDTRATTQESPKYGGAIRTAGELSNHPN